MQWRLITTGAVLAMRCGTPTAAEAILKLRAVHANGDFDEYWRYHQAQEQRHVHDIRYHNTIAAQPA